MAHSSRIAPDALLAKYPNHGPFALEEGVLAEFDLTWAFHQEEGEALGRLTNFVVEAAARHAADRMRPDEVTPWAR
jgi:hypothetical protein